MHGDLFVKDSSPEPTNVYGISLALACVGVTFVGIGLQSAWRVLAGGDAFSGGSYGATFGALLTFGMLFLERATRWQTVSAGIRLIIGYAIVGVLVVSIFGTVFCLYVGLAHQASANLPLIMGVLSAFFQVFTLYWLFVARPRYVSASATPDGF